MAESKEINVAQRKVFPRRRLDFHNATISKRLVETWLKHTAKYVTPLYTRYDAVKTTVT